MPAHHLNQDKRPFRFVDSWSSLQDEIFKRWESTIGLLQQHSEIAQVEWKLLVHICTCMKNQIISNGVKNHNPLHDQVSVVDHGRMCVGTCFTSTIITQVF